MSKTRSDSPEVHERAVRLVFEHQDEYSSQWSAICSIASKIGRTSETLRQVGAPGGSGPGPAWWSARGRAGAVEGAGGGNRELHRANEILRKAEAP